MRIPRMTIRRWIILVAVVGGMLGLGIGVARRTHFRRLATDHHLIYLSNEMRSLLPEDPKPSLGDHVAQGYHRVLAKVFGQVADILGEPDGREDPFPGKTFDEIIRSVEEAPTGRFVFLPGHPNLSQDKQ